MTDIINYKESNLKTKALTEEVLCSYDRTASSNMNEAISFTKSGLTPKMDNWAGWSKLNVALFNGLNSDG
jgi:hypothetical protein